ncbi:MAG: M17 family peptidase N-terminal domain-containing protein, partial [Pseudomonadota bacterium]
MSIQWKFDTENQQVEGLLLAIFQVAQSNKKKAGKPDFKKIPTPILKEFNKIKNSSYFQAKAGEVFSYTNSQGKSVYLLGLGEKSKFSLEIVRKESAKIFKALKEKISCLFINMDTFATEVDKLIAPLVEAAELGLYDYQNYKSTTTPPLLKKVILGTKGRTSSAWKKRLQDTLACTQTINFSRDLISAPPNELHPAAFAKKLVKDIAKVPRAKIKIFNKKALLKERMNLFLAVNAGSHYPAQMARLDYTPAKKSKKTKHLILVGKGLTFDSGGYSLKPAASMVNMKYDMSGAAVAYGAFKILAQMKAPIRLTCLLGLTDNLVDAKSILPDSIIK